MKINLSKLRTLELADFANQTIAGSITGQYVLAQTHPLFAQLQAQNAQYQQVYSKLTYSGQGPAVSQADQERDAAYTTLRNYLNAYRKLTTLPNAADAEVLYQIFRQYGTDLHTLNYAEESAQLLKLLEALGQPIQQTRLQGLNLIQPYEALRMAHIRFTSLYSQQAEANAELRSTPSATAVRQNLEKALRRYLDLLTLMSDTAGWAPLYQEVRVLAQAAQNSHRTLPPDAAR